MIGGDEMMKFGLGTCMVITALNCAVTPAFSENLTNEKMRSFAGSTTIELVLSNGMCTIDPNGTSAEKELTMRSTPIRKPEATLVGIAVDCETAHLLKANKLQKMTKAIFLHHLTDPSVGTGEAMLKGRFDYFSEHLPMSARYWQLPPVQGSALFERDGKAVYLAVRTVDNGKIASSGVAAYFPIGDAPLLLTEHHFDGLDHAQTLLPVIKRMVSSAQQVLP